ncbi:hypothetical protein [Altericista sp. CCNU0014]|uniref:hypothetical protein n=1 Tax=Altericista sp. CCNU0014 TaxID=3082949 RepID=UPI00384E6C19
MRDNEEYDPYLPPKRSDKDRFIVEIPLESKTPNPDRLPSGFDLIQSIGLEGRAFRGIAGGRIPWWILITGWVIFGGFALLTLSLSITSGVLSSLPFLLINGIPIVILWRGTAAKFTVDRHKSKRK